MIFWSSAIKPAVPLDPDFGTGGMVSTDFFGRRDTANGVVLQADGKLVLAGLVSSLATGRDFGLSRYLPDGSVDPTFGADGKLTTAIADFGPGYTSVFLQPDGKVVAGVSVGGSFLIARYNTNGSLDQSFGIGGFVTTEFDRFEGGGTLLDDAHLQRIAMTSDGKIVAAGSTGNGTNFAYDKYILLARYNTDGSLDTTFSNGGQREVLFNASNFVDTSEGLYDMLLQPDGRIVTMSFEKDGNDSVVKSHLRRFNVNGTNDFDSGAGPVFLKSIVLEPDGKFLGGRPESELE
jgi:uncharacterized delta-60 repeat protein